MSVILYSTGCPKCKVIETKLKQKGVEYTIISDIEVMTQKGFMTVPILEVDDVVMDFVTANKWINERK